MKKIFFSILVVFMLTFSMIGDMNLVKAAIPNVVVSSPTVSPQKIILGAQGLEQVRVTFTITNNRGDENQLFYDVVVENPVDYIGNPLTPGQLTSTSENNIDTLSFTVTKRPDTIAGIYDGRIIITETHEDGTIIDEEEDGQPDNTEERTYQITVESLNPRVTVTDLTDSQIVITSEEDNIVTKTFTLQNSGNVNLAGLGLTLTEGTFTDGTNSIRFRAKVGNDGNYGDYLALNQVFSINTPLAPAGQLILTLEASIPQDIDLDNYSGRISISDSDYPQAVLAIPLTVRIEPGICSDGRVSDRTPVDGPRSGNLRIKSIDNPDDNEDFKIGDEISIEGDVENKVNQDMDVIIEALLYDLDDNQRIGDIVESDLSVEKDTTESFDLTMEVPNDNDIDPDHTYILYVKASRDGDENIYCNYDSVEINLDRDSHDVMINSFTITPTVAYAGEIVSFRVAVENIGTSAQSDAYIVLENADLGLNMKSNPFDLKKYSSSGNDNIQTFTFTIPEDAGEKEYTIEATVYFHGDRDTKSEFSTLKVQAKAAVQEESNALGGTGAESGSALTGAGTTYIPNKSIFGDMDSTKTLFIIGDVVLVILAILFLILIFKKR